MARKSNEDIRKELDELNAKMTKRQHISDVMLIKKGLMNTEITYEKVF